MEKIDKAIEILQAFKEGKTIESKYVIGNLLEWRDVVSIDTLFSCFCNLDSIRIKKQPTYRPYANAEEFLKASKEHGPYIKFSEGLLHVPTINKLGKSEPWRIYTDTPAYNGLSFEDIITYHWQDGTLCGVLDN